MQAKTDESLNCNLTLSVADVRKTLLSVSKIADQGNLIQFGPKKEHRPPLEAWPEKEDQGTLAGGAPRPKEEDCHKSSGLTRETS